MTSPTQVARLLTLVPYLQSRAYVDLADVADDFGVSQAQILADLEVLVMCGLPGGLPDDLIEIDLDAARSDGWIHLRNAPELPPLRFTRDEASSLIVAVAAVREVATAESAEAAQRVLDKLIALTDDQAGQRVSLDVAAGDQLMRQALSQAIEASRQVRLTYDGAARRETTRPLVDPVQIEVRDGASYLVAWAIERDDWRTYRLDRIAEVSQTGTAAQDHGAPPVSTSWFDMTSDDNVVTLELEAPAAWVGEYYPIRSIEKLPDGGLRLALPIGDPHWLTGLLLRLGPQVRRVDPPQAAADAIAEASLALS